jgi:putative two-component system hydrogenase maturation factor HypX/HoxX
VKRLRILLLSHSFNSLTQRIFVALREQGHELSVEFDINDNTTIGAVELFTPDLIIAPFLKRAIPEQVWCKTITLIIHPGPAGDRGPSSLDWAIINNEDHWGVTLLQANEVMDGGDIWGTANFPMRNNSKSSLYRNEITELSLSLTLTAIDQFNDPTFTPTPQQTLDSISIKGGLPQKLRTINWESDNQQQVLRKLNSADGIPGVKVNLYNRELFLYAGSAEESINGEAGEIVARSNDAICIATVDQKAVWIGQIRDKNSKTPFKLPAAKVLKDEISHLPLVDNEDEIRYEKRGEVGIIHFSFYNGAMSSDKCQKLQQAYLKASAQQIKVILLFGGDNYWSNGMDLNMIEASNMQSESTPAEASWENINAMDDLTLAIIENSQQITISAVHGNCAAGGVFLARSADLLWAREGVILNPHYKDMGNLYGSEYWSYLLPRYAGSERAQKIMGNRLPIGVEEGKRLGLIDESFATSHQQFIEESIERAHKIVDNTDFEERLKRKKARRSADEKRCPLSSYRTTELENMHKNFYGSDPSYHIARYNFVYKVAKSRTPLTIARHRRKGYRSE